MNRGTGEYKARARQIARTNALKKKYGITDQDYDALLESQGGLCAVCGQPETRPSHWHGRPMRLAVDHDHATGKVRGLLCFSCNAALGHLTEDAGRMRRMADYSLQHKAE